MSQTITSLEELRKLPFGSAVLTSDRVDTVVLKDTGEVFHNQSGMPVTATTLWHFGRKPFTVLWQPEATA